MSLFKPPSTPGAVLASDQTLRPYTFRQPLHDGLKQSGRVSGWYRLDPVGAYPVVGRDHQRAQVKRLSH